MAGERQRIGRHSIESETKIAVRKLSESICIGQKKKYVRREAHGTRGKNEEKLRAIVSKGWYLGPAGKSRGGGGSNIVRYFGRRRLNIWSNISLVIHLLPFHLVQVYSAPLFG